MVTTTDPRVRRTRQLLQDALAGLMRERTLRSITVQDITERAQVNRATFYAHFEDKYALLNHMVTDTFVRTLHQRADDWSAFTPGHLRLLIITAGELLSNASCHTAQIDDYTFALRAVQHQMYRVLAGWVTPPGGAASSNAQAAAMATSWAIFGTLLTWTTHNRALFSDDAADQLTIVIMPGLQPYLQA